MQANVVYDKGRRIELDADYPLTYSDPVSMSAKLRNKIDIFEKKYCNSTKIEYGQLLTINGTILETKSGTIGSVSLLTRNWKKAYLFTHIHPRDQGILGGTFSLQDIKTFTKFPKAQIMRAVAKEGAYTIIKGNKYDGRGLTEWFEDSQNDQSMAYNQRLGELADRYFAGEVGVEEYIIKYWQMVNSWFCILHNVFIDGQKKFDYKYSLELVR